MTRKRRAKRHGPLTLTQFKRKMENDYDSKPWRFPVFSYGINANIANVENRCPEWPGQWAEAWLDNHHMSFDKQYPGSACTYCNIRLKPGRRTYGALLWLDKASFKQLDVFEGYPVHYERKKIVVHADGHGLTPAWAYWSDHVGPGAPSHHYATAVLQGLMECHAPERYLDGLMADLGERFQMKKARQQLAFYEV